jgi:hypothetical protein
MIMKVRIEEIIIGALLGAATGYALTAPLLVLVGTPLASLWPLELTLSEPVSLARSAEILVSMAGIVGLLAGAWFASRQESEQHLRGVRYIPDVAAAHKTLQAAERDRMSPAQRKGQLHGVTIGGVELARAREVGHAMLIALPDSGKSVLLRLVLDQALARGDRIIAHDPKGEFIEAYFDPRQVVLLGPWDLRAAIWSTADIDSPALVDEFAAALCGVADSGQNRSFHAGAAVVLGGLIKGLMRNGDGWTWAQLGEVLHEKPDTMIRRAAEADPAVRHAIPSMFAERQRDLSPGEGAIISILSTSSRMLLQLAAVDHARPDSMRFSLRNWLVETDHQRAQLVVLNNSAEYPRAAEALFGAMLAVVSAAVASRMHDVAADGPGIWLIVDEAPQLGAGGLAKVQIIAEVGRSRGVRVWQAAQSESQFAAKMGGEQAAPLLSTQNLRIYLRTSPADAESIARRYGDREIQRLESTASQGAVAGKIARYERVPVLIPSDLLGLRVMPGGPEFLFASGDVIGRLIQPFPPRRAPTAPAYVECSRWRAGLPSRATSELVVEQGAPSIGGRHEAEILQEDLSCNEKAPAGCSAPASVDNLDWEE